MNTKNSQATKTMPCSSSSLYNVYRTFRIRRRGTSAVEFAVVAPVFFLMVFGMIEYGRMVMVQQVITNAAREGARQGVLDGSTDASVKAAVVSYMAAGRITANTSDVTIQLTTPSGGVQSGTLASAPAGTGVAVTITISFNRVSWLRVPLFLGGRNLVATTTMRKESSSS